jgi:hypothetical protein
MFVKTQGITSPTVEVHPLFILLRQKIESGLTKKVLSETERGCS